MNLHQILTENGGDLTDHNVAVLSDWAADMARTTPNPGWKRAYALIREGADLLLRRRARSTEGGGGYQPTSDLTTAPPFRPREPRGAGCPCCGDALYADVGSCVKCGYPNCGHTHPMEVTYHG